MKRDPYNYRQSRTVARRATPKQFAVKSPTVKPTVGRPTPKPPVVKRPRPDPRDARRPQGKLPSAEVAERVRKLALQSLTPRSRTTTNLYEDVRVLSKGTVLGPPFQPVLVDRPSLLVFADDDPGANFGHDCRYLLYDAKNGDPLRAVPAQFPPSPLEPSESLRLFHEPVPVEPADVPVFLPPVTPCPPLPTMGRRYAILFAGVVDWHHLNDLELCYRALIDRYGFSPDDIFSLIDSGKKEKDRGPFSDGHQLRPWPNAASTLPFRIEVKGPGTSAAFRRVLRSLDLKPDDLLFIHTDGHGGDSIDHPGESFICTYVKNNPDGGEYLASKFGADLHSIGTKYRALLVMMGQCCGGGFNDPIVQGSTAQATSVACAALAGATSNWTEPDHNWNHFAFDWIKAQMGRDLSGAVLSPDADGLVNGIENGAVEALEAFNYACLHPHPEDSPNYSRSQPLADNIAFSQPNALAPQWCALIAPILNQYYTADLSGSRFYENLSRVLPELQALVIPVLQQHAFDAKRELMPRIEAIVAEAFKKTWPRARRTR
jgi:hypothetical protein